MRKINGICPHCMGYRDLHLKDKIENIVFRTESFKIKLKILKCTVCNEEFNNEAYPDTSLASAYENYKQKHNILSADEIKCFRNKIGITQGELSTILGWGKITISRYETGAIPEIGHNRYLRMIMNDACLKILINASKSEVPAALMKKLNNYFDKIEAQANAVRKITNVKESNFVGASYAKSKPHTQARVSHHVRPVAPRAYEKKDAWRIKK